MKRPNKTKLEFTTDFPIQREFSHNDDSVIQIPGQLQSPIRRVFHINNLIFY